MRQLITSNETATVNYIRRVESLFHHHKIDQKISQVKSNCNNLSRASREIKLNAIDKEVIELLINAEKNTII